MTIYYFVLEFYIRRILDLGFGDSMIEEQEHLKYTLSMFDEVIEDSKLKLSNLKNIYKYDYEKMLEEKYSLENYIDTVSNLKNKPFFARIDFKTTKNFYKCYIGKVGISDYDNNIITVDWRAPIASLYYDSNVGETSYNAPEGVINGDLLLKRQYDIENGKLISFNDVDTVSDDELLKPYLDVSMDNRLKNIVATIQSEQNQIIREKLGKNIIIQGVAGSGKTTVALHRIAYLVYNNRDLYKPEDYMVIGPNKFFVDYISNILPDLDVNGVSEYTLDEILLKYLNCDYKVNNSLDKIDSDDVSKIKTSFIIKEEIDKYFDNLVILPDDDFKIKENIIVKKEKIQQLYSNIDIKFYKSIKSRIDRLIILINKYVEDNQESIVTKLIKKNVEKNVIDELKNNLAYNLKKYFKILKLTSNDVYITILKNLNINLKKINKNEIDFEDIPSLLYIRFLLCGDNIFDNYKHIVIDEAQDYGEFMFYSINCIFKNASFSIYGDLAQSLYSYRSIQSWNTLKKIFKNVEIINLNKSYRTTIEIMNEANKINKKLNLIEAIPVIRHGDEVVYTKISIIDLINEMKEKYKTIAIITKDQEQANKIYKDLNDKLDVNLISSKKLKYDLGINILPSYLSKGLEFDAVIVQKEKFDDNNIEDLKLLYVSMTRALHKLYIKI